MTWQPLADVAPAGPAEGGVTEDTQVMERRRRLHTGATSKTHRRHIQVRLQLEIWSLDGAEAA